jgi:Holliday junction resolvase-like predicted endonuclease
MKTLWKVSKNPTPVERSSLSSEKLLEEMLISNLRILSPDWMLLGNQVSTGTGFIDILAVSRDGTLVVIELKRERATRDVVAQTLDYISWMATLPAELVSELFQHQRGADLAEAFAKHFGTSLDVEQLNSRQMGVIVASTPDQTTERIVKYLANSGTPINLNTFEIFGDGNEQMLSPNWSVDLAESQANATSHTERGVWNGHYYGSFGHEDSGRNWEDARRYGFFSAGGGAWYSRSLSLLNPDDIIWVQSPEHGYIGVGRVLTPYQPMEDIVIRDGDREVRLLDQKLVGTYTHKPSDDDDTREHAVLVDWLATVPLSEAVRQVGFFGNQNSVCRPRVAKWNYTVNTLRSRWKPSIGD